MGRLQGARIQAIGILGGATVLGVQVLALALLHLVPRRYLQCWLQKLLRRGSYRCELTFSGRVALHSTAQALYSRTGPGVALIPDYVCNVVERAFTLAHWTIETYETDDRLEPDPEQLLARIQGGDVRVLVGASVFGSSSLLDFVSCPANQRLLRQANISVVLDLAQDISLIDQLPASCSDLVHAIVSFNDKSFIGAMGGGVLCEQPLLLRRPHSGRNPSWPLYRWFAAATWQRLRAKVSRIVKAALTKPRTGGEASGSAFEYSYCTRFPYTFDPLTPTRLQMILAVIGLYSLPIYRRRKQALLRSNAHVHTRHAASAAYVLYLASLSATHGSVAERKLKAPYGIDSNPAVSRKPLAIARHNKGFLDCD